MPCVSWEGVPPCPPFTCLSSSPRTSGSSSGSASASAPCRVSHAREGGQGLCSCHTRLRGPGFTRRVCWTGWNARGDLSGPFSLRRSNMFHLLRLSTWQAGSARGRLAGLGSSRPRDLQCQWQGALLSRVQMVPHYLGPRMAPRCQSSLGPFGLDPLNKGRASFSTTLTCHQLDGVLSTVCSSGGCPVSERGQPRPRPPWAKESQ